MTLDKFYAVIKESVSVVKDIDIFTLKSIKGLFDFIWGTSSAILLVNTTLKTIDNLTSSETEFNKCLTSDKIEINEDLNDNDETTSCLDYLEEGADSLVFRVDDDYMPGFSLIKSANYMEGVEQSNFRGRPYNPESDYIFIKNKNINNNTVWTDTRDEWAGDVVDLIKASNIDIKEDILNDSISNKVLTTELLKSMI